MWNTDDRDQGLTVMLIMLIWCCVLHSNQINLNILYTRIEIVKRVPDYHN